MALRDFELLFKNDASTNKNDIYYLLNYRISVLKEGVIRIENSKSLSFLDKPTQFAINRHFISPEYEVNKVNDGLLFEFSYYSLFFNGNFKESYILYKNKKLPLKSGKNLGGTYHTIDGYDGDKNISSKEKVKILDGILTNNGLYILDDTSSYLFDDNYAFLCKNPNELDIYIFFYPYLYKEALHSFYEISGYPPLLPKYVFGNWWSRYFTYTEGSYLYLLNRFKEDDVPFTVATIDMDWHYSSSNNRNLFKDIGIKEEEFIKEIKDNKKIYHIKSWNEDWKDSIGWTGYSFNKALYQDPDKMLKTLRSWNYHITLNLHPADGIAFYEDCYQNVLKALNLDYKNKETVEFDLTDNKNREVYFKDVLLPLENKGIDFWWIDWQQGENSKFKGLSPLWLCNHYFYLENYRGNNRPLILSRFAGRGSHRYPLGFSGDSVQSFATLKFLVESTSQASNIGFTYWSHDIGGHFLGEKNSELFLKSVQFGCFSPINRLHCSCSETNNKDYDLYLDGNKQLIESYLRFRHRLIPFIYSHSLKTHLDGRSLLTPLYYEYPLNQLAYKYSKTEYLFGDNLLVAPFIKKRNFKQFNKLDVLFLDNYYDIHFGYKYNKDTIKTIYRTNDTMPLFLKEGSFLLLDKNDKTNDISNPNNVILLTTTGNGSYTFLEDDNNFNIFKTTFKNIKINDSLQEIKISFSGNESLFKHNRIIKFKILNAHNLNKVVNVNNATLIKAIDYSGFIEIYLTDFSFNKEVNIIYEINENDSFNKLKRDLLTRIIYLDESNSLRDELYNLINKTNNLNELKEQLINKYQSSWFINLFKELIN